MREHEQDFELAILFNSIKNLPGYGGCLKKTEDSRYIDTNFELAYNAFAEGIDSVKAQLKRFDEDRFIPECVLREVGVTEEQFRLVLKHAGDSPVGL